MANDKQKKISELPAGGHGTSLPMAPDSILPTVNQGNTVRVTIGSLFGSLAAPAGTSLDSLRSGKSGAYIFATAEAIMANGFPADAAIYGPSAVALVLTTTNNSAGEAVQRVSYLPDGAFETQRAATFERFYHGAKWSEWYEPNEATIPEASTTQRGVVTLASTIAQGQAGVVTGDLAYEALIKKFDYIASLTGDPDNILKDGAYNWAGSASKPEPLLNPGLIITGDTGRIQQFVSRADGLMWVRKRASTGVAWGSWQSVGGVTVSSIVRGGGAQTDNAIQVDAQNNVMFVETPATAIGSGPSLTVKANPANARHALIDAQISTLAGNALTVRTEQQGNPGLFVPASSGGGIEEKPAGTVLDSITTPGVYIVHGSANMNTTKHPFSGKESDLALFVVSTASSGQDVLITQTYLASNFTSTPGSFVRMRSGGTWGAWDYLVNYNLMAQKTFGNFNLSQLQINLHNASAGGGQPGVFSYKTPGDSGPNVESAPSNYPGVEFSLPWRYSTSVTGTFGGIVIACDQQGDIYINVDKNIPDTSEGKPGPGSVNWRKVQFSGQAPGGTFAAPAESIAAGVDLNTMITPGAYHQDVASNATSANNYPVQLAGALIVYTTGAGQVRQYYYSTGGDFMRIYDGTSWATWGDASGIRWAAPSAQYTGNLNALIIPGSYYTNSASSGNNWPTTSGPASVLVQVAGASPNANVTQTVVANDGRPRTRYSNNGGTAWSSWQAMAYSSEVPNIGNWAAPAAGLTGSINGVIGAGSYWAAAAQVTPANGWPVTNFDATLQVYRSGTFVQQICESKYRIQSRYSENSGSSWTTWDTVAKTSDIPARLWWLADNVDYGQPPNAMTSIADQGIYQYAADSFVTIANGFPVANVACILECRGGRNNTNVQTCYISGSTSAIYDRYRNAAGNGWLPWVQRPAQWAAQNGIASALPNTLSAYNNQGVYQYSHSSTPITTANGFPYNASAGERAELMVLCGFGGGDVTQLCFRTARNQMYMRSYTNAWGPWAMISTASGSAGISNIASQAPATGITFGTVGGLTPNAAYLVDAKAISTAANTGRTVTLAYAASQMGGQGIEESWKNAANADTNVITMPTLYLRADSTGTITLTGDLAAASGTGNTEAMRFKVIAVPVGA